MKSTEARYHLHINTCLFEGLGYQGFGEAYMRQWTGSSLLQVIPCRPIDYLNQCGHIVNWTIWNSFRRNLNHDITIFHARNVIENIVCTMVSTLAWPQRLLNIPDNVPNQGQTGLASHINANKQFAHYSDVTMSVATVCSTVCSGADQRKHHGPRHWPLWGESNGDRWIPLKNGQLGRKCFHLMMQSWFSRRHV